MSDHLNGKKKTVSLKQRLKERFTIMIVPHNQKGVKNLNLPKWLIITLLLSFIALFSFSAVTITKYAYLSIKQRNYMSENEDMIKELESLIYNSDNLINVQKTFGISLNNLLKTAGLSEEVLFNDAVGIGGPLIDIQQNTNKPLNEENPEDMIFSQIEEIKELAKMESEISVIDKKVEKLTKKLKYFEEITRYIPSIWPILGDGNIESATSSKMIITTLPFTPIVAAADGRITSVSYNNEKITITIGHKYQFISVYSNIYSLDENIKEGSAVKKGQIIGFVSKNSGKTFLEYSIFIGNSNGIHSVNPVDFTYLGR
ncbi:MAG TPA: hypothetical protein DHW82_05710 [Spirochaetia bacterium]|nr:hypothetical protein [Spirochaetia bacterium]